MLVYAIDLTLQFLKLLPHLPEFAVKTVGVSPLPRALASRLGRITTISSLRPGLLAVRPLRAWHRPRTAAFPGSRGTRRGPRNSTSWNSLPLVQRSHRPALSVWTNPTSLVHSIQVLRHLVHPGGVQMLGRASQMLLPCAIAPGLIEPRGDRAPRTCERITTPFPAFGAAVLREVSTRARARIGTWAGTWALALTLTLAWALRFALFPLRTRRWA